MLRRGGRRRPPASELVLHGTTLCSLGGRAQADGHASRRRFPTRTAARAEGCGRRGRRREHAAAGARAVLPAACLARMAARRKSTLQVSRTSSRPPPQEGTRSRVRAARSLCEYSTGPVAPPE
uniref:Uncharacterized protein n=1 Tax=Alexandrium monilatum TaxID=311494 RepID=A0A7S4Q6I4_9DINO